VLIRVSSHACANDRNALLLFTSSSAIGGILPLRIPEPCTAQQEKAPSQCIIGTVCECAMQACARVRPHIPTVEVQHQPAMRAHCTLLAC
jgi:hypothetical protein